MGRVLQNPMTLTEAAAALDERENIPATHEEVPAPEVLLPDDSDATASKTKPLIEKGAATFAAPPSASKPQ